MTWQDGSGSVVNWQVGSGSGSEIIKSRIQIPSRDYSFDLNQVNMYSTRIVYQTFCHLNRTVNNLHLKLFTMLEGKSFIQIKKYIGSEKDPDSDPKRCKKSDPDSDPDPILSDSWNWIRN